MSYSPNKIWLTAFKRLSVSAKVIGENEPLWKNPQGVE